MSRRSGSSTIEGLVVDWVLDHPVEPSRLPAPWLTDDELADELQRVQQRRARDAAYEAELILALAGQRPASDDPAPDHPGARRAGWTRQPAEGEISEFFTAELATVLNVGRPTAANRLTRALTWQRKLPATFAALKAGTLDERRVQQLADALQHTNADVAARVEEQLLGEATDLSVTGLGKRATELMLRFDAAADEARGEAEKTADVHLYPSSSDGRSVLAADLPADEAAECHDLLDQLARMLEADGDDRPIGQLRTQVLSALIRRPADHGLPAVAANLTVTAALAALEGGSTEPGEVNGLPITAAHLRDLLTRVGALGLTAPDGGTLTFAVTGPDGELLATLTPAELTRLARRGCPKHPDPGEAGRDGDGEGDGEGDGDGDGDGDGSAPCSCPLLGPPPPTDRYRPTERQRVFVTTRDRRCRFPNCGQRVGWADLDHVITHACGGATDCTNLCCLCRSHHRLKTHASGWQFRMTPDGTLQVTTPSGVARTTRPPGLRPPEPEPPSTGSVTGPPPAEPGPPLAQDPPPF
ncbi:DUF222 domain-containing protein [Modestobacter sp. SYSU DS0657]